MATTLITVDCKLFQRMLYRIIPKVRKFHQPTANRFNTARKTPAGGHNVPPPSLNRVNSIRLIVYYLIIANEGLCPSFAICQTKYDSPWRVTVKHMIHSSELVRMLFLAFGNKNQGEF